MQIKSMKLTLQMLKAIKTIDLQIKLKVSNNNKYYYFCLTKVVILNIILTLAMIANIVVLCVQKRVSVVAVSTYGNIQNEISFAGAIDRNIKW